MRWMGRRQSTNVEDRRGGRITGIGIGGGAIGLILVVVFVLLGGDPSQLVTPVPDDAGAPAQEGAEGGYKETPDEAHLREFVSVVLADTEDAWRELFSRVGRAYSEPTLVLFTDMVESGCGYAQAAVGPFYCPPDQKVYIDLGFYRDLQERFGAPGDFAQAYVIAHEVGHHVQNLLGISNQVQRAQGRAAPEEANSLSVRLELQADCLAGVWAHHAHETRQLLEAGDIEEGLGAASAIGDDRIQMQSRGYVAPESFTHGSSRQRVAWFKRGIESGDMDTCNTFSTDAL